MFRDGCIEAVKVRTLMERDGLLIMPATDLLGGILQRIVPYMTALQLAGATPPIVVMVTLLQTEGAYLGISNDQFFYGDPLKIDRDTLALPPIEIAEYGTYSEYASALQPAFDALWNAVGIADALSFTSKFGEGGVWGRK